MESVPSRIIWSVSKFAGALVGTVVVTGKRITGSARLPSAGLRDKAKKKSIQTRPGSKKKVIRKTKPKVAKTKKKKVVKRKSAGSTRKGGVSKKKAAQSSAKKKKGVISAKKTARRKTKESVKSEGSSLSRGKANVPVVERKA